MADDQASLACHLLDDKSVIPVYRSVVGGNMDSINQLQSGGPHQAQ